MSGLTLRAWAVALAALTAMPLPSPALGRQSPFSSRPVSASIDGRPEKNVRVHSIKDVDRFSLDDVRRLFGGRVEWQRMSRLVVYELYSADIAFPLDDPEARVNGRRVALESSSFFWDGKLYVPAAFFSSKAFQDAASADIEWNPADGVLSVRSRPGVSSPEVSAGEEGTLVSFSLAPRVRHRVLENRGGVATVRFYGGATRSFERIEPGDQRIESLEVRPKRRSADLELKAKPGQQVRIRYDDKDRRLVFAVSGGGRRVDPEPVPVALAEPESVPEVIAEPESGPVPSAAVAPAVVPGVSEASSASSPAPQAGLPGASVPAFAPLPVPVPSVPVTRPSSKNAEKKAVADAGKKKPMLIVVDAGHGGKDAGAIGPRGTLEKNINLALALDLARKLKSEGYRVLMTRDDDQFIPLEKRTAIANKAGADLFVSIHCNAALNRSSKGFELYFLSEKATDATAAAVADRENAVIELEGPSDQAKLQVQRLLWSMARVETLNESSEFAAVVSGKVGGHIDIPHRGVKQANFYVLRGADMPAILVESAFITHNAEEKLLRSKTFQSKLSRALLDGIRDYGRRRDELRHTRHVALRD